VSRLPAAPGAGERADAGDPDHQLFDRLTGIAGKTTIGETGAIDPTRREGREVWLTTNNSPSGGPRVYPRHRPTRCQDEPCDADLGFASAWGWPCAVLCWSRPTTSRRSLPAAGTRRQ